MSTVTLTVCNIAGETVWAPESIFLSERCSALQSMVAVKLGQAVFAVQLSHGGAILNPIAILKDCQFADGDSLTVTVNLLKQNAYEIMERLMSKGCTIALDPYTKSRLELFLVKHQDMPEDIRIWLELFIETEKVPHDFPNRFVIVDLEFQDGLLYLSQVGHDRREIRVFVDCAGKLTSGTQDCNSGSVWYADVRNDNFNTESGIVNWSTNFWFGILKDLGNETTGRSLCIVEQAPTVVADSLSNFFQQWSEVGHAPIACFRNSKEFFW